MRPSRSNALVVLFSLGLFLALSGVGRAESEPTGDPAAEVQSVLRYRRGLADTLAYARSLPVLGAEAQPAPGEVPAPARRVALRQVWATILDYSLALESLRQGRARYYLEDDARRRSEAFLVFHGAWAAQYRFALEWIDFLDANAPNGHTLLNEPLPEVGLRKIPFPGSNSASST